MNSLKEIAAAYKKINAAYCEFQMYNTMYNDADSTPTPDITALCTHYMNAAAAAKKVIHLLEKYNLPMDTIQHLSDEIEFAVWVKAQQA